MTEGNHLPNPMPPRHETNEILQPNEELRFMGDYAVRAGDAAAAMRRQARATKKLDRTDVTDWDQKIERDFREEIQARSEGQDSVIGEEEESGPLTGIGTEWIIDPIDGTGEYVRDNKENGEPIEDSERTTCVGIAQFKDGVLMRSVVYNPFKRELFVADRELGGAFLNGERLDLRQTEAGRTSFGPGIPYDYAHWDGAPTDARFFEEMIGGPPIESYSAINQACDVARGKSAFDVFPGNTIHDIAPSALMVELAGGEVSGVDGQPLDWQNLNGAVYAVNPQVHARVVQELQTRATA
jgi:fructose-1,6-bisphosphatase/inositol monophosphatase family enzyme